jgi:hypothetical protein
MVFAAEVQVVCLVAEILDRLQRGTDLFSYRATDDLSCDFTRHTKEKTTHGATHGLACKHANAFSSALERVFSASLRS